jgi:hypothetical protein
MEKEGPSVLPNSRGRRSIQCWSSGQDNLARVEHGGLDVDAIATVRVRM